MKKIEQVDIFGDSILKGIQINPKNQRYRVDNHIDIDLIGRTFSLDIRNHSQFGCTVTKGYSSLQGRLDKGMTCDMIIMDYGGNDCDFDWKSVGERPEDEHLPKTPLHVFGETYRQIIETVRQKGIQPVLTTLPPIEPQRFFDWFCRGLQKDNILKWLGSVNTISVWQEHYSRVVERIARETKVPLVDLRDAFLSHRRIDRLLCEDGTHPNTEGQQVITKAFMSFAERLSEKRKREAGEQGQG